MTLKQAILALPKISKKWTKIGTNKGHIYNSKKRLLLDYAATRLNSILELHATAESIGVETTWITKYIPLIGFVYYPHFIILNNIEYTGTTYFNSPLRAIQAAFIAAVEYRLKEGK